MKNQLCILLVCLSLACGLFPLPASASPEEDLLNTGVAYLTSNQPEKAITIFSRLILLSPDNARAYMNRGEAYIKTERYDLAIGDFEKAKQLRPDMKGLFSNLGAAWFYKEDCGKAIENYTREIEQFPDNYMAFFNRGLCHLKREDDALALADMENALALKPDLYWALCYKGDILAKTRDTEAAKEAYEGALALESENPYAGKQLAALEETPSAAADPDEGLYHIQTGAFLSRKNAERQYRQLAENQFDATIVTKELGGKTFHMVRVGQFNTITDARDALETLKEKTGLHAFIQENTD